jgi:hypothetical protein
MSLIKCLASISLAAIALPTLYSEPRCPGNIASLPFHLVHRSRIIVPVVINHTGPYEFLLDTGDGSTIVDPALAAELHLKTQGLAEVVGVGFNTHTSFAYLELLEAGSHWVANHPVVVQDLQPLHAADLHFRGILGGDFLGHFDVLMGLRPQYALPRRHKGDAGSRERCAHRAGDTASDGKRSAHDHAGHPPGSSVRLRGAAVAAYAGFGRECIVPFQPCLKSGSRVAPNQAKGRLWCRWSETRVFDLTPTEHANRLT